MALTGDGQDAAIEQIMPSSGSYRILLEGDRGVMTESSTHSIRVIADRPPEFRRVAGLGEMLHEISSSDVLSLQLSLADDIGISAESKRYGVT